MNLDNVFHADFCRAEDAQALADSNYEAFLEWRAALTKDQELGYALAFIESLTTVTGSVRGEIKPRDPWFGKFATVAFDGAGAFEDFLRAKWVAMPEVGT